MNFRRGDNPGPKSQARGSRGDQGPHHRRPRGSATGVADVPLPGPRPRGGRRGRGRRGGAKARPRDRTQRGLDGPHDARDGRHRGHAGHKVHDARRGGRCAHERAGGRLRGRRGKGRRHRLPPQGHGRGGAAERHQGGGGGAGAPGPRGRGAPDARGARAGPPGAPDGEGGRGTAAPRAGAGEQGDLGRALYRGEDGQGPRLQHPQEARGEEPHPGGPPRRQGRRGEPGGARRGVLVRPGPNGNGLEPLRALIVEDSEDDALLVLRELRRGGYEPVHERVETPEGMREALEGSAWDVVISDYRLPRFDAPAALELAREAGSRAPFVVVSGRIGEEEAVAAMKAGAHDYVMKDNLVRLCATVGRGLDEARRGRERQETAEELRRREVILDAVRFAAERLLGHPGGWEESVRAVLRRLGEAAAVSRVYVFENFTGEDGKRWNAERHKWVAPGVEPGLSSSPGGTPVTCFPYGEDGSGSGRDFGRWEEVLGRGEPLHGNTRDFPQRERRFLAGELGILSMVLVPIFVEGRWWGFIGFDECRQEREWSGAEIGALGAAAGTLGAAIRRRQVEEQLRASEERYRAVVEQATDGIYLLDAENRRLLETNPSFREMLGYDAGEMVGMPVYGFVAHPRDDVDATIRRTLDKRRRVVGDRKYRRRDGTVLDVEVGVNVISLDGRDVICTVVRDVTERKRVEEALARSEGRLRTIVETEPECVKVLGPDGSL